MRILRTRLCEMLRIDHPIVQAPMAGVTTVELVAAVCEAGALGGFGHAYTVPDRVAPPYAPSRARQFDAVCDIRPAVITVHVGDMTPETLARLRGVGAR